MLLKVGRLLELQDFLLDLALVSHVLFLWEDLAAVRLEELLQARGQRPAIADVADDLWFDVALVDANVNVEVRLRLTLER